MFTERNEPTCKSKIKSCQNMLKPKNFIQTKKKKSTSAVKFFFVNACLEQIIKNSRNVHIIFILIVFVILANKIKATSVLK